MKTAELLQPTILNYKPTTEESNNVPVVRSSSESQVVEPLKCDGTRYVQAMEHPIMAGSDSMNEGKAKFDVELLAQNRGNAMLRYKEKKKHRRCIRSFNRIFSVLP